MISRHDSEKQRSLNYHRLRYATQNKTRNKETKI